MRTTPVAHPTLRFRKVPKRLPRPVPEPEVADILSKVTDTQDRLLFEVLAGSGLRRSEAALLKFSDVDADGILQVVGKGNKQRQTFLTQPAFKELKNWAFEGHMKRPQDGLSPARQEQLYWEFVHANPDKGVFLGTREEVKDLTHPGEWVYSRVKKYTDAHPHQFRHFWVTDLLNNGADMMAVMDAAGHESISTTRGYKKVLSRETTALRSRHSRQQGRI